MNERKSINMTIAMVSLIGGDRSIDNRNGYRRARRRRQGGGRDTTTTTTSSGCE
jgi:hypothetical protein